MQISDERDDFLALDSGRAFLGEVGEKQRAVICADENYRDARWMSEAELIETFLARRLEIPPEVRRFNGQRIADMISTRQCYRIEMHTRT